MPDASLAKLLEKMSEDIPYSYRCTWGFENHDDKIMNEYFDYYALTHEYRFWSFEDIKNTYEALRESDAEYYAQQNVNLHNGVVTWIYGCDVWAEAEETLNDDELSTCLDRAVDAVCNFLAYDGVLYNTDFSEIDYGPYEYEEMERFLTGRIHEFIAEVNHSS